MVRIVEAEGIALNRKDSKPLVVDHNQSFFKRRKEIIREKERRELIRYRIAEINRNSKIRTRKNRRKKSLSRFRDNAVAGIIGGTFRSLAIFVFGLFVFQ